MDAHLSTTLQASLGAGYTLVGELGGGSMSRVFLAEEHALGRRVVVKVLPHYLATEVSLERFRREIQLAAALQHPLIVPVLSAGERDGLRYYTMPYIAGESLRATLAARGRLAIPEVLVVVRDVASALAYAHRRGVVHRDIKPDNILLCEDHALVTDFGVARALETASVRHLQVTSDGEAVGTAAYMAPEQVTGDPSADHRVDIYALGILAYELLTGNPPFTGQSLHGILTAHLADDPVPPAELRPEIGPELSDFVLGCLEKRPEDRWQSADDILEELEGIGSGSRRSLARVTGAAPAIPEKGTHRPTGTWSSGSRRPTGAAPVVEPTVRRRRLGLAVGVAAAVAVAVGGGFLAMRGRMADAAAAGESGATRVAVLPFRVVSPDSSLAYLREGMVDLLAAKLNGVGDVDAIDPRTVVNAWRQATGTAGDLSEEAAVDVARRLGARRLLLGGIVGNAQNLVFTATLRDLPEGTIRAEASVSGSADSLLVLVDRLSAQLLAAGANVDRAHLGDLTSRSLPALKEYLAGQSEYRRGSFVGSIARFNRALELDSNFALAALGAAAAGAYGQPSEAGRVAAGVRLALRLRERLSERDRALFDAYVPVRYPQERNAAVDLAAWQRATEKAPDRAEIWYGYADRLFHTGAWVGIERPWERAQPFFARAAELDSTFVPPFSHLLEIAIAQGDTAEVRRLAPLYFARDSSADEADGIRWRVAVALDDRDLREQVRRDMPTFAVSTLARIMAIGQIEGVAEDDVDRAARVLLDGKFPVGLRTAAGLALHNLELNRGHPRHALDALDAVRKTGLPVRVAGSFYSLPQLVAIDGIFGSGDTTAAATEARALEARIAQPNVRDHAARAEQYADVCLAEIWRVRRGERSTVDRSLGRLRAGAQPSDSVGFYGGSPALCAAILEVEIGAARHAPTLRASVERLDSLMRTGPAQFGADFGNLVVARHLEALGDPARALAALRRRPYYSLAGTFFLAPVLAEQGRLASRIGDTESAVRAYRHYLFLRAKAEAEVRPEVERVRLALQKLGG